MMRMLSIVTAIAVCVALGRAIGGEKDEKKAEEFKHKFVSVTNCKLCHSEAEVGDQFGKWKKSKHAEAFKTLQGAKAKEIGKKQGIDDPSKSEKCLKCHVTGANLPEDAPKEVLASVKAKIKPTDGIQCESCHGAGGDYAKKDVFEKGPQAAMALGLIEPNEKVCAKCHNPESPTWTGKFDFKEAVKHISHANPKKAGKKKDGE
jgi:hypothetical protein